MEKKKYDSTVAMMAGNIAAGMVNGSLIDATHGNLQRAAVVVVAFARAIVAEVERTELDVPFSTGEKAKNDVVA